MYRKFQLTKFNLQVQVNVPISHRITDHSILICNAETCQISWQLVQSNKQYSLSMKTTKEHETSETGQQRFSFLHCRHHCRHPSV